MALLFLRHGSTGANSGDSDPSSGFGTKDYFRGWSNVPLSPKGNATMTQTAQWFSKNGIKVDGIVSSDMSRAVQSAQILSQATGASIQSDPRLRPLNVGKLTGQEITPELLKILDDAHKNRDNPIPGGESYNQFLDRYKSVLPELLQQGQGKNIVAVTHHRNLLALPHIFFGQAEPQAKGPPVPGGVMALGQKGLHTLFEPPGEHDYQEKAKS
jgi:broad specificity phosphatase PhoE